MSNKVIELERTIGEMERKLKSKNTVQEHYEILVREKEDLQTQHK